MRVRARIPDIDAFRPFIDAPPAWFQRAMDAGKITYHGQDEPHFILKLTFGISARIVRGDWVLRRECNERIWTLKPGVFEQTYEVES